MKNLKRRIEKTLFISIATAGLMSGAQATPLPSSTVKAMELPVFFLVKKHTEDQDGKMYFKLPCNLCPQYLNITKNTIVYQDKEIINASDFFLNKNYQANLISYDYKNKEALRIELRKNSRK